jgi:hypothetical protein
MPAIKIADVKKEYSVLPEGKYEVFVDKFDEVTLVDGVESSRIMFTIRKDVDSVNGNRKAFTNIRNSQNYVWMFNALSKALGIPADTEYETLDEFLDAIKGKSLVIKIRHKPNPRDAAKPYVNITDFFPTTKGDYKVDAEVLDDNLPF